MAHTFWARKVRILYLVRQEISYKMFCMKAFSFFYRLCLSLIFFAVMALPFAYADAKYMTEWTNPDGTKSKSPATFYSMKEAKTQSTPKLLSWECGMQEHVKWVNWEIDFEKNVLRSWWQNHDSGDYKPSTVDKILSAKDGSIRVQGYLRDGKKVDKDKVVVWEFHYPSDPSATSDLYSIWNGNKHFFKYCKNTTPVQTASTAQPAVRQIGHYANDKRNRFIGSYKDGGASFEGYWVQEKSGQECSSIVDGSRFYGKVWFKMVSEGKFEGRWGYCDTAPIFAWNGHQVSFTSDVTKTLSSKQQRVKIQRSLNFFGFNAGSPDGVFGKKTKTAIGELQTCWAGVDPSASTFPKTTEFGVLTPRQMQTLMETYDTAQKSYSKANCFYFQTLM